MSDGLGHALLWNLIELDDTISELADFYGITRTEAVTLMCEALDALPARSVSRKKLTMARRGRLEETDIAL